MNHFTLYANRNILIRSQVEGSHDTKYIIILKNLTHLVSEIKLRCRYHKRRNQRSTSVLVLRHFFF
ncbi:hypothetical protein X777_03125 [Ooceraea biroi]|uniref:Uncharacterized protein n=1 Tax=Ooceraea biroi TaxID=2015173 RepID=A0A026WN23_OOCBI|nr:hypothetical protein X777_03125 [Ooceraea biroi]